jgi:hypothetical protein
VKRNGEKNALPDPFTASDGSGLKTAESMLLHRIEKLRKFHACINMRRLVQNTPQEHEELLEVYG